MSELREFMRRVENLMLIQTKRVLTSDEAQLMMGISKRTLDSLCTSNQISFYKQGQRRYFKKSDIDRFLTKNYYPSNDQLARQVRRK